MLLVMGTIHDPLIARGTLSTNFPLLELGAPRSNPLSLFLLFGVASHLSASDHAPILLGFPCAKFLGSYFRRNYNSGQPDYSQIRPIVNIRKLRYYYFPVLRSVRSPLPTTSRVLRN